MVGFAVHPVRHALLFWYIAARGGGLEIPPPPPCRDVPKIPLFYTKLTRNLYEKSPEFFC